MELKTLIRTSHSEGRADKNLYPIAPSKILLRKTAYPNAPLEVWPKDILFELLSSCKINGACNSRPHLAHKGLGMHADLHAKHTQTRTASMSRITCPLSYSSNYNAPIVTCAIIKVQMHCLVGGPSLLRLQPQSTNSEQA